MAHVRAPRVRRLLAIAAACGISMISTFAALADDQPAAPPATPPVSGQEIADRPLPTPGATGTPDTTIITATRTREPAIQAPYSTNSVTQQDIIDKQFRSSPEALQEIPGVMVQKTAHGQGSPFIRGFTGFRTLFLIDGIRLNNSTFREGPNQYFSTVDPLSVQTFEVVKGPSSVLYGSDAIGGTVNSLTKTPNTYGRGWQTELGLYQRAASGERSYIAHPEIMASYDDRLGIYVGGSIKEFGDLESGDGRLPNTGYDEWSADLKLEYFLTPNQRLVFAHQEVQQNNVPRTHSTFYAVPFEGSAVGTDLRRDLDQYRDLTYLQYHAENLEGFVSGIHASVSWHDQFEREDRTRSNGAASTTTTDVGTLGFSLQLDSPTPIGLFSYGFEYYRDNVSSFSSTNSIQGPVGDDSTYDLLGIFIQDQIQVTKALEVTLGARFTYAKADIGEAVDPNTGGSVSFEEDWSSVVGSARATYFIVPDDWAIFGGVSQGFRAPNLSDLSRLDFARSGEFEVASFDLDPEEYISYEIGVKAELDNFSLQAAYFFTDIKDMIVRRPTGGTGPGGTTEVSKANGGDGYVHGVELGASYRFHRDWTVFGAFTWQEGYVDQFPTASPVAVEEPLSRVMPMTGLLGVRWDHPDRKFFAEGVVTVVDEQDKLNTADEADTQRIPPGGTPGYEVFSVRAGYRFNDLARVTVAVENIFDEDYRVHGSGVNGVGRNFVIGLELTW